VPAEAVLHFKQVLYNATHYYADAYPCFYPDFGAGVVAAFLGSRVQHDPLTRTAWFHPLGVPLLADLTPQYDPQNIWWRRVQDVLQTAIGLWGPRIAYGQTDLGGNLDILASLRGTQNLLLDLHDAPAEVDRLVSELTRLWLRYYAALQCVIQPAGHGSCSWVLWYPTSGYMLQSDFSYMISPKAFERYVLPDLEQCCAAMDYPFYHLDGKGALKHLDMLLALPKLKGVQWVPGDGQPRADKWPDVLRRIRAAGKLCQIFVDRQGAFDVARELGGSGFLFAIDERLTNEEAEEFLEAFWRALGVPHHDH
jgi:5-methyltetrahydrofolate--homocysteine methyltransferase